MKCIYVDEHDFKLIINKSGAELTGSDVGNTHAINFYTRNGKGVGTSRWVLTGEGCGKSRVWSYEVAKYLYDAYATTPEALKLKYLSEYESLNKQKVEIEERISILDGELSRITLLENGK